MLPKKVKVVEKKLGRENAYGLAWHGDNVVEIDPRQTEEERLDTLIHELLHLMEPEWEEEKVEACAAFLASLMWKQGYRRVRE